MLATTDCSMSPVEFMVTSESVGEEAYQEAFTIAEHINAWLDGRAVEEMHAF